MFLICFQVRDPNGEGEQCGLKSSKYVFEKNALDNGKYEEKNKCFCRKGSDEDIYQFKKKKLNKAFV